MKVITYSLYGVNLIIGAALSVLIFEMYPYAHAIGCEVANKGARDCPPPTLLMLICYGAVPLLISTFIVLTAHKLENKSSVLQRVLLWAIPFIVTSWIALVSLPII